MSLVRVALDVPLPSLFDYRVEADTPGRAPQVGDRIIVPFGRKRAVGVVVELPDATPLEAAQLKSVARVLDDTPPLPAQWMALCGFAAAYYHRPLGEVMLPAIPGLLRRVASYEGPRSGAGPLGRLERRTAALAVREPDRPAAASGSVTPRLNPDQIHAVDAFGALQGYAAVLLYGVTGSGKTEVYLRIAQHVIAAGRQVLLLVPEINLTPQLESLVAARFPDRRVVSLHSALAETERLAAWVDAFEGRADIVLGTRLAVMTPMPRLGLIVVDEEHDPSYKQQEGLRYSARDLAVWRAKHGRLPVILGSATPSIETWHQAERGRYLRWSLRERAAADSRLPQVTLLDTRHARAEHGFMPRLVEALRERLARGEQSLVFLNRRGYAPVLSCAACGWVSHCARCSAFCVLHRGEASRPRLHCHHCGSEAAVPRACPTCGNQDLLPLGRGTQRIEERLAALFPEARILRIDADSTRRKGAAGKLLAQVHRGEVDILVGTQMVAKGHDFKRLTLVGVLNADAALFSHDFRAAERLFAQLMQVSGRAGRADLPGEVMVQTGYPHHPLYQALVAHDYPRFASSVLAERESAGFPPYTHQALLRAEARQLADALAFLGEARRMDVAHRDQVTLYDPVPMQLVRKANVERAQLLVECASRPALQAYLEGWVAALQATKGSVRWTLEVDPLEI